MAVVQISNYYAEWMPSGGHDRPGVGRLILRSALRVSDLYHLSNLHPEDFRILLRMLQTEKPIYLDTEAGWLRTAHPQTHDAEPVGGQESGAAA
jgi:23S rRNA A2030 N6-methylase RlmJ